MTNKYDAVIVGSGPNGLTAGIVLAAHGLKVKIYEAASTAGGGLRSMPLTLPGFLHDHCSGVHPMGFLSPIFKQLKLEKYGLEWIQPDLSVAHPLENDSAVLLQQSVKATAAQFGIDEQKYIQLFTSLISNFEQLLSDVLQPLGFDKSFPQLIRFGIRGLLPATTFTEWMFREEKAKALFAGCAAHSILPLEKWGTAAVGLIFMLAGHSVNWPVARNGSRAIAHALVSLFERLGGEIVCESRIKQFDDLPSSKVTLFDLSPFQLAKICSDKLPLRYLKSLGRYTYGPSVFKIDYALSGSIPWKDPNCVKASTVHVGGTIEEIAASEKAAWDGKTSDAPFVMVCQQSDFDPSRAPSGKQTGYAYCHVPHGSDIDYTNAIEKQIERFAPGFRDCIEFRHVSSPKDLEAFNPANHGGTITGGSTTLRQIFFRPTVRLDPYSTPNPKIFLCSHATPPGGGVHGMCGYNAARSALKKMKIDFNMNVDVY